MGREVRMVPADWEHPKEWNEHRGEECYRPLLPLSFMEAVAQWEDEDLPDWIEGERLWREEGKVRTHKGVQTIAEVVASTPEHRRPANPTYDWWAGEKPEMPNESDYMPSWPDEQRTHFMMYEDTSEGTPISPAFPTAEELAQWLADNGASAFAGETATYAQWLNTIRRGFAPSAVIADGRLMSGVEALS